MRKTIFVQHICTSVYSYASLIERKTTWMRRYLNAFQNKLRSTNQNIHCNLYRRNNLRESREMYWVWFSKRNMNISASWQRRNRKLENSSPMKWGARIQSDNAICPRRQILPFPKNCSGGWTGAVWKIWRSAKSEVAFQLVVLKIHFIRIFHLSTNKRILEWMWSIVIRLRLLIKMSNKYAFDKFNLVLSVHLILHS